MFLSNSFKRPGRCGSGTGYTVANNGMHNSSMENSQYTRTRHSSQFNSSSIGGGSGSGGNRYAYASLGNGSSNYNDGDGTVVTWIFSSFCALTGITLTALCTVGLLTILLLLYLVVRPFSLPTYRRLSSNLGAAAFLDAIALLVPNTRICLTGDSDVPSPVGASVLVCNHLMDGDWWVLLMLGRCVGLRGSLKVFLRNEFFRTRGISSSAPAAGSHSSFASQNDVSAGGGTPSMVSSVSAPNIGGASSSLSAIISNGTLGSGNSKLTRNYSNGLMPPSPVIENSNGRAGDKGTRNSLSSPETLGGGSTTSSAGIGPGQITLAGYLLHKLLEFPLLSSENNKNYIQDRNDLFALLRSFAEGGAPAPVHLLLFPEGWPLENKRDRQSQQYDRRAMLAKSIQFAKREGRPQLKHLLLPRTTGFYASLESLRESSPVVYDVTMAYRGYDGELPFSLDLSWPTLWRLARGKNLPSEVHIRIRRYSMEEVLQDAQWLDKQWAEKDRLLAHFSRHQQFPSDNRGFCRHRVFDTRLFSVESSLVALVQLGLIPFAIPVILLLSIPLLWVVMWVWLTHRAFTLLFPRGMSFLFGNGNALSGSDGHSAQSASGRGGADSLGGTPFVPVTPFASPTHMTSWGSSNDRHDYSD